MANVIATWTVELNCNCPQCKDYVDLLSEGDLWDGEKIWIG